MVGRPRQPADDARVATGIVRRAGGPAWSEGPPLSLTANQLIAGMAPNAGGFTFQELNLTIDDIAAMSHGGADLSYDFITRPAYHHALLTAAGRPLDRLARADLDLLVDGPVLRPSARHALAPTRPGPRQI